MTGREQPLINDRLGLVGVLRAVPFGQSLGEFEFNIVCAGIRRAVRP